VMIDQGFSATHAADQVRPIRILGRGDLFGR